MCHSTGCRRGADSWALLWESTAGEGDEEDKEQEENRFSMPGGVRLGGGGRTDVAAGGGSTSWSSREPNS